MIPELNLKFGSCFSAQTLQNGDSIVKKMYKIAMDFSRLLRNNDVSSYASSIAFFLFLSMIPVLMLLCAAIPFTPLTEANLMMILTEIAPDSMDPMMVSLVSEVYDKSAGILSFAIIMTIWSAGKGMLALMRALNATNGVVEERSYLRLRSVASFYTVVVLMAILITLCMGVFGKQIFTFLLKKFPILEKGISFFSHFRFLFVLLFLVLAFTLLYTYIPNKKMKLLYQIPGAVFAGLAWIICSFGFSLYLEYFNTFSAYGSLGTIILFLLWLYLYCYILLIGANINGYLKPLCSFLAGKYRGRGQERK